MVRTIKTETMIDAVRLLMTIKTAWLARSFGYSDVRDERVKSNSENLEIS